MTRQLHSHYIYPGGDYPHLNRDANTTVRIELGTPKDQHGNGHVHLRIMDGPSGTVLVSVDIDPTQMWMLMQGGSQTWPAFVSPHLDRVGKRMLNQQVVLPTPLDGDTARDERRDVDQAVREQLPSEWHGTWDSYDQPRRTNRQQLVTVVRRWVAAS